MTDLRYLFIILAATSIVSPSAASEIPAPPFETAARNSVHDGHSEHVRAKSKRVPGRGHPERHIADVMERRAEVSAANEETSTSEKVKKWTRGRWVAARKNWSDKNAKFYGCSNDWRRTNNGARYTFHDQREFIFRCMNDV